MTLLRALAICIILAFSTAPTAAQQTLFARWFLGLPVGKPYKKVCKALRTDSRFSCEYYSNEADPYPYFSGFLRKTALQPVFQGIDSMSVIFGSAHTSYTCKEGQITALGHWGWYLKLTFTSSDTAALQTVFREATADFVPVAAAVETDPSLPLFPGDNSQNQLPVYYFKMQDEATVCVMPNYDDGKLREVRLTYSSR